MKVRKPECPSWVVKALQGLSYWIGYRHSLYAGHPLPEAAMVVEACNLIFANLRESDILVCERLYRTLLPEGEWPDDYGSQARADLVVLQNRRKPPAADARLDHTSFVAIEVKRATASRGLIDRDLQRLACLKQALPENRAMLFVISEARRPAWFVESNGVRNKRKHRISGTNTYFRVVRACKATSLFSGKNTAHYSCVLEVFLSR
jgi:hypothetical protein